MKEIIGDYAVVSRINVKSIKDSLEWYKSKLGFEHDPRFDSPNWSQLTIGIDNVAIGLNQQKFTGSGKTVLTFVTDDIQAARESLIKRGVKVSEIENAGQGVSLVFFEDIDGNLLGLRQNPLKQPSVGEFTK